MRSKTMIEIDNLQEGDIDSLHPLVDEFILAHPSVSFKHNYWDAFRSWFKNGINDSNAFLLAATIRGYIAGFIVGDIRANAPLISPDIVGHVSVLVVASKFRKNGVGDSLWNELRRRFLSKGVDYFELYTEYGNETSGPFWHKRGFDTFLEKRRR